MAEFDSTGRSSWVSDLAEIPEKYGVNNVYGDLGQLFAWTSVASSVVGGVDGDTDQGSGGRSGRVGHRRGMTGAPQWQIEGLRRLEIPKTCKRNTASIHWARRIGPVKTAVLAATQRDVRIGEARRGGDTDRFAA